MKLLVIVLCLLSERFLIHAVSYQRFYWFSNYCSWIQQNIEKNKPSISSWMLLVAIILPILLVVSLVYLLFHGLFYGFLGLLLSLLIFLYCLGPQNAFYPLSQSSDESSDNSEVANYLAQANSQLFSIIFWYVVAGPIAILAYRLITLCQDREPICQQAKQLVDILEWIPARIAALLYLLVGNFQQGFRAYTDLLFTKPELNHHLLKECGLKAAYANEFNEIPLPGAECLVEHAVIVLTVCIALFTLAAWM